MTLHVDLLLETRLAYNRLVGSTYACMIVTSFLQINALPKIKKMNRVGVDRARKGVAVVVLMNVDGDRACEVRDKAPGRDEFDPTAKRKSAWYLPKHVDIERIRK